MVKPGDIPRRFLILHNSRPAARTGSSEMIEELCKSREIGLRLNICADFVIHSHIDGD